jgi:CBS domain-containing protein
MTQKIRDLMGQKQLVTVDRDDPILKAAQRMKDADVGDVIVKDGTGMVGILTDRDIVVRALAEGLEPAVTTVDRICSKDLATLSPDDEVDHAIALMRKKAVRRVPIVQDGQPVGILSIGDLAQERDPRSALAGISAAQSNC